MSIRLASLLALAVLAVAAPSASALTMTDYKVTVEGSATYSRSDVGPGAFGDWVQNEKAEFSWKAEMPSVTFIDNTVATSAGTKVTGTIKSASMDVTIPTPEGPVRGACSGSSWHEAPQPPVITGGVTKPEGATSEGIYLHVLSGGSIKLSQCSGSLGSGPMFLGVGGSGTSLVHPWKQFFEMPHEAIGMGKIIQLLSKEATGVNCPGHYEMTDHCTLKWNAKVTFVRTFTSTVGEPEIGPAPPEEQVPPPAGPTDPAPPVPPVTPPPVDEPIDLEDLFIPLPTEAKLDKSAAKATLRVICPTGCTGTAVATLAKGSKARGAAAAKALARTRFTAEAGRPATVRLRFAPRVRRAIRRAGGVRVAFDVRPNGGARQRTNVTIPVR